MPDCQSYERLPCSCHHVLLSPYENGFWPGFDHLWQKASLERLLTLQQVYFREQWGFRFIGHHFWHSAGFGNFKNGLDTPYFTATSYAQYFPEACHVEPACRLTQAFSMSLNWVVTLKQFSVFPEGSQVEAYIPHLAEMADAQHVEAWRGAPWYYLLEKPHWAEAFLFLLQELEELLTGQPVQESAEDERFARSVARMGSDVSEGGACREVAALREVSRESRGPERFVAMARLQHAVFQPPCGVAGWGGGEQKGVRGVACHLHFFISPSLHMDGGGRFPEPRPQHGHFWGRGPAAASSSRCSLAVWSGGAS